MGSDAATSSRASIISVDPAIASQITGTTVTGVTLHSRSGSSPYKSASEQHSHGHVRNKSVPIQNDKHSLRRAKNSTEMLRQRSTKSTKRPQKVEQLPPDSRGGRNFTVGNVGTGGLMYLKPSPHQNVAAQTFSPPLMPLTAPPDLAAYGRNEISPVQPKPGLRSATTSPDARSNLPGHVAAAVAARKPTKGTIRSRRGRSQSFSTINEHQSTLPGRSKTLKIVINRPGTATDRASEDLDAEPKPFSPTLEVPIPHYRLGQPRFSTNGTPVLRSSAYTRDSATPSELNEADTSTGQQFGAAGPSSVNQTTSGRSKARQIGSSGSDSTIREHISADIYDALAEVYDDPDVVRYSHNVREITAATPARLIAQISSESFMDYELVSDFFLTFRSYMSVHMVMDLLLARLRWAINRQEDDGRIIRVRTFAALRHWILNYFADDFISHRKLRIRFCDEINHLYRQVAARQTSGTSDLKVLRDLKRCWNGRCSMFWDSDDFNVDGDQDEDLMPGLPNEPEVEQQSALEDTPPLPRNVRTVSNSSWFNIPPGPHSKAKQHTRQESGKQGSLLSEQSLQATSCTLPSGFLRASELQHAEKGSHPVPVQLRRPNAQGNLEVKTGHLGHRRAAASIDSDREPTPRGEPDRPFGMFDGSLIRGSVYAPSAPFVQIVSSPSAPTISRFDAQQDQFIRQQRRGSPNSANSPGVKNIFGSLRKALAGKHSNSDMSVLTVSAPIPISEEPAPPRAQLPLNMSKSNDELRSRAQAIQNKGQLRIDLLCAQVAQNYELLFPHAKYAKHTSAFPEEAIRPAQEEQSAQAIDVALSTPDLRTDRLVSHTTARSGSILIVNDTGMGVAAVSGALPSQAELRAAYEAQASPKRVKATAPTVGLGIERQRPKMIDVSPQRSSDALGSIVEARPAMSAHNERQLGNNQHYEETALPSSSPRPQPQSPSHSVSTTQRHTSTEDFRARSDAQEEVEHEATPSSSPPAGPARGLRRRPGGDLRKVENVNELPHHQHHESVETTTTASPAPSIVHTGEQAQKVKVPGQKTVSMINTHSSQHLRPSFEAAVAGFSDIPDDDDGGLEATLLKLEGRYEKESPPLPQHPLDALERRRSMPEMSTRNTFGSLDGLDEHRMAQRKIHDQEVMASGRCAELNPRDYGNQQEPLTENGGSSQKSSIFGLPLGSEADAEQPVPLLQRDTNSVMESGPVSLPSQSTSKMKPSPLHLQRGFQHTENGIGGSYKDHIRPTTADESAQSFLLDEDENLSDLSSEISEDIINHAPNGRRNSPIWAAPGTAVSGLEIPSHPLTYASVVNLAPPEVSRDSAAVRASQPYIHLPLPKTMSAAFPQYGNRISGGPAHIPFILAADSQTIAQQMTLIEKSALTEIEWSDLVDMKWDNTSPRILDWAEYLTKGDINGVDLVITRFNLVSRWVRSQIVLTHDIDERAQVIAKYIHVAAHARRLHNYATMVQITIGLTSTDATRLSKTWERVPGPDKSLLKNMERLVQPTRNFHELRLEIDSADFSDGCIPFIGLYVHDLTYNAQKPSTIPRKTKPEGKADASTEPLINFERYRTAAVIVKGLLRLIDASSRYSFEPIKGLIERCLWMASLPDEKIYALSRALEEA